MITCKFGPATGPNNMQLKVVRVVPCAKRSHDRGVTCGAMPLVLPAVIGSTRASWGPDGTGRDVLCQWYCMQTLCWVECRWSRHAAMTCRCYAPILLSWSSMRDESVNALGLPFAVVWVLGAHGAISSSGSGLGALVLSFVPRFPLATLASAGARCPTAGGHPSNQPNTCFPRVFAGTMFWLWFLVRGRVFLT